MVSLKQGVEVVARNLSQSTDSDVIHLRALRKAIGWVAVTLPFALVAGENLRDALIPATAESTRVIVEGSMSAYFHTGMREVFVGSLCAIGVFLVCYKGPERWDKFAARIAGVSVLFVALFPTAEPSREAPGPGEGFRDSMTIFSGPNGPDPGYVNVIHLVSAAVFFLTLAGMSIFLFTKSGQTNPTVPRRRRRRIYIGSGIVIIVALVLIAIGKLIPDSVNDGVPFVFWFEAIAVVSFGISWLTKAHVIFGDDERTVGTAG
jgi:hypothetical protein